MVFQSKAFVAAALLSVTQGARVAKRRVESMAGVPVHKYRGDAEEWLVLFKPGTSDSQIQSFCGDSCRFQGHPSKRGVPFAEVHGKQQVEKMVAKHRDQIAMLEPDGEDVMIPEIEEVEPAAASWGLDRVGVSGRPTTGLGVHVYVQDTGVRGSHQDFEGRVVPTIDLTSGTLQECADDSCAGDRQGHGTHCAGTAAGRTYGVASGATVHAVKTLSDQGSGARSWQMSAIDWVTTEGERPAVISMSLGGSGADPSYTVSIGAATEAGVTVVVAAGNSNSDSCNFSPAFTETAITVGATTSTDTRASYSNFGSCNNIMAPGSAIVSADAGGNTGSRSLSGTSMACPHVSGAAALILEADPSKTSAEVLEELLDSAVWDALTGLKTGDTNALLYVAEGGGGGRPAPTPAPPPGTWQLSGTGCQMIDNCISSNNYPNGYGNNQECTVRLFGDIPFVTESFETESRYDKLTVGGVEYSGNSGPPSGSYTGAISWSSDYSVTKAGWKMCRDA